MGSTVNEELMRARRDANFRSPPDPALPAAAEAIDALESSRLNGGE
jgi:hypothetical protein